MSEKKVERKVSKKVSKKKNTEKKPEQKGIGFSLADISSDLKKFKFRVMNKDTKEEVPPYMIPFKHRGLQKITGGIIGGKFAEISGMSGGGKSFLGYELISQCQKMGGVSVLFDGERAWEDAYGDMLGINMDDGTFMLSEERDIDNVFAMMTKIISKTRSKKRNIPILFVIDSYFTLATKVALEKAAKGEDPQGFYHKQKNGKFSSNIDTFVPTLNSTKSTLVLLNQTRTVVNEYTGAITYKTLCEEVIQFITTQRIQGLLVNKKDTEEVESTNSKGKIKIRSGIKTTWQTIKNRVIRPFQKVTTTIKYDSGLRRNSGLVELFVNEGFIKPATTTIDKDGEKVSKSIKGFKVIKTGTFYYNMNSILKDHPEFLNPKKTSDVIQKVIDEDFE